ncbi:CPBP family intramembrane glutamic endopeptidase [Pseudomonas sp. Hp2]|uniref:CPBP family intramembrane glutamic endopeptidase n=1 Tax=Pseudomonas sp. Hp2 TaxID=701189 RepID=UPI00112D325D
MSRGHNDFERLFIGVLFSIICSGLISLSHNIGVVGGKAISEFSLYIMMFLLFGRENVVLPWSVRSVVLIFASSMVIFLIWLMMNFPSYCGESAVEFSRFELVLGLITTCLTAPLFEEKVVRHFMLDGLIPRLGNWGGTLIVSVIFASAHWNNFLWAFAASLVLCVLKIKFSMDTEKRAVVHGLVNFGIVFLSIRCSMGGGRSGFM